MRLGFWQHGKALHVEAERERSAAQARLAPQPVGTRALDATATKLVPEVRVSFPDGDARVKVGMTANLTITVNEHDNVLVVPSSALAK